MNNIDPYNNIPPGKAAPPQGRPQGMPPQQMPYGAPPQGLPHGLAQRQRPQQQGMPPPQTGSAADPQQENFMLRSDLQEAIGYIQKLGGTWPPPGH